jgi:hypothetical protein
VTPGKRGRRNFETESNMRKWVLLFVPAILLAVDVSGQTPSEPRVVGFPGTCLVEVLRPGDRHVVILHPNTPPLAIAVPPRNVFAGQLVEQSEVIIVTRIVAKRPIFLDLQWRRVFTPVPQQDANWVGSSIEMRIERIIKNSSRDVLQEGERLTYIEDSDGSTIINGTRVDTETNWLRPIEVGRRYIMSGRFTDRGFMPEGTWEEPAPGLGLRQMGKSPPRRATDLPAADDEYPSAFGDWNVDQVIYSLQLDVDKRAALRR